MYFPTGFTFVYVILLLFAVIATFFLIRWLYVFIKGEKAYPNLLVSIIAMFCFYFTAHYFDVMDEILDKIS